MPRKKPFSGKQKKHQLQEKRDRKRGDGHHRPPHGPHAGMSHRSRQQSQELLSSEDRNSTSEGEMPEVNALNQQPSKCTTPGMGKDKQYDPNRYHLHFQKESKAELALRKKQAMQPYDPLPESALEVDLEDIYQPGSVLDMPKRPPWDYNISKDKLEQREEQEFRNYLQSIYEKFPSKQLSYFEINLETWRQLWRVLEMSDIVLLIADIRHPALHFSPALYDYVTRDLKKHLILVLNKIDLAPPSLVVAWRSYFKEKFPQLQVICFTSFPRESQSSDSISGFKRRKRGQFTAVGPMQLLTACETISHGKVDLSSWREKIEAEMRGEEGLAAQVIASNPVEMTTYEEHEAFKDGIITIGCVGHPNVGKSSVMNGLCGRKVVSASRTPGHTKHFQTIFLTPTVKLCDSPGLVFPSLVDKQFQILSGIYPIAQVQEPYTAVGYLAQRIPLTQTLRIRHPEADGSPEGASGAHWSAYDICEAWAEKRGFITAKAARKDVYRAANNILRMAVDGRLCMCMTPPGYTAQKEFWEQHQETLEIGRLQDQHRRVEENVDREGDREDDLSDQFTSSGEDSDADVESNDVDKETDLRRRERRKKGQHIAVDNDGEDEDGGRSSVVSTKNPFDLLMDA